MKLKLLFVGLVALLSVSSAVAAPPDGKGKPKVTVVLKGTFVSASASSLSLNVTRTNRWGRAYNTPGPKSVKLDEKTKVRGNGMKSVADLAKLKEGDRVLVQARVCKADLKDLKEGDTPPELTAVRVVGHPAKAEEE